jgi:hypothetical protein
MLNWYMGGGFRLEYAAQKLCTPPPPMPGLDGVVIQVKPVWGITNQLCVGEYATMPISANVPFDGSMSN